MHRACLSRLVFDACKYLFAGNANIRGKRRGEGAKRYDDGDGGRSKGVTTTMAATPSIARLKLMASARFPSSVLFAPHTSHVHVYTYTHVWIACACVYLCVYMCIFIYV